MIELAQMVPLDWQEPPAAMQSTWVLASAPAPPSVAIGPHLQDPVSEQTHSNPPAVEGQSQINPDAAQALASGGAPSGQVPGEHCIPLSLPSQLPPVQV
jgi:hypothetical protein